MSWFKKLLGIMKIEGDHPSEEQNIPELRSGGYLGYYGLREWYDSQPKAVQRFLFKSCGYGINTDSRRLIEGNFYSIGSPEDEYPWTATKFLCNHAMTAYLERLQIPFDSLMEEAKNRISSAKDREYFIAICGNTAEPIIPKPPESEIKKLKAAMIRIIQEEPGYLQSTLRKAFPEANQEAVGLAISRLNHKGLVRREKKGNSFQLFLAEATLENTEERQKES